jgi:small GTP-binding protein
MKDHGHHGRHRNHPPGPSNMILLVGNPNVGKSVLFNRLTGAEAVVSNYPGTTVDYTEGTFFVEGTEYTLIDVPGTYSLDARDKAEEVAVKMIRDHPQAIVILVLDATRIERGLYLAFEVMEMGVPVVLALNMMDVAREKRIAIDVEKLHGLIGVPVVPLVGISGEGLKDLGDIIWSAKPADIEKIKSNLGGVQ